ncbi:MAG: rod shape-determining protein MreD [Erysipelotrichales bacterium]|nr:rod shape-determining protein MreD [Erysipelotrichales bacterium]
MSSYVFLLLVGVIIDTILSGIFPYDTSYLTMSVVPQLTFIILMLLTRKCELKQSLILALIIGLLQDVYGNTTFFMYMAINIAMVFVAYFWTNSITDTVFENFFFIMTILFLREIVVFAILHLSDMTRLSIMTFIIKREFLTILVNGLLFFIARRLVDMVYQHLDDKDIALRKNEKIAWINMNLKEERRN